MFSLTRLWLKNTHRTSSNRFLTTLLRAVNDNIKRFKYVDCAFCLKGVRDILAGVKTESTDIDALREAEKQMLNRLATDTADYFSITIWAQSLQPSDVESFVQKLQSDHVIERLNTFSIASILVSLSRLNLRDEYLIDRMIIRINRTPHQLTSQVISNILNSLVKLRYENSDVIETIYKEGVKKKDFTAQGIATTLNAISHFAPLSIPSQHDFVTSLLEIIGKVYESFTGQATAVVLNSLSKLRIPRESEAVKSLFAWLPNVIPKCDGQSIAIICKALSNFNVLSDEQFILICTRLKAVLQEVNEQGMHFVLDYVAMFTQRESTQEQRASILMILAEHIVAVSGTYTSMGVTYCLHGLAKCQCTSNELFKITMFNQAISLLEKETSVRPTNLSKKPKSFNGQEVGILLNAMHAFQYENRRLVELVLSHIVRWLSGYTTTEVLTTLWGIARVRKMIHEDSQVDLEEAVTQLYDRIEFSGLGGRALGTIALSYGNIGVSNDRVIQNLQKILETHPEQIEMKYLSIILTMMYSQQLPSFDTILTEALAKMSLNANTAHVNSLARILHLAKTCSIPIPPAQVDAICALVEILFPKIKSFELSHILVALKSFSLSKLAIESLDQYANIYVKQILKNVTRSTLERFVEYFCFSKGASEETLQCMIVELSNLPVSAEKHAQWLKNMCSTLASSYPQCTSVCEYQKIQDKLRTFQAKTAGA